MTQIRTSSIPMRIHLRKNFEIQKCVIKYFFLSISENDRMFQQEKKGYRERDGDEVRQRHKERQKR